MSLIKRHFLKVPLSLAFWYTLALSTGILLAHYTSLYAMIIISAITSVLLYKKPYHTLLAFCFFLSGWCRYRSVIQSYKNSTAKLVTHSLINPLSGAGIILENEKCPGRHSTRVTLCITQLRNTHLTGTVQIYLRYCPAVEQGDIISFSDLILKQQTDPDYLFYLYKEGISGSLYTEKLTFSLIKRSAMSFHRVQSCLHKKLSTSLSPQTYTLFCALFLGKKNKNKHYSYLRSLFLRWGIVHYLARSGLHVIVLIKMWSVILNLIPLGIVANNLILLLLVALYYLLSYPSISFLRACIVYGIYRLFSLSGSSSQLIHTLSLTTLIVLIVNPLHLFFLDFLLSFSLTCALAFFRQTTHQIRVSRLHE